MFKKKFRLVALILCVFLTIGYFAVNTGAVSTVLLAIQGAITDGNLVKFSGTNGIGVDAGLSATNVVKCKFDATSAPTINNDVDEGYTVGSRWLDVTNDKSYVCLDNSDGAAVWIETTGEGGGATTFTGLTDTPANYIGSSLKHVRVNVGETALEFVTLAGGGDMLKATYDIDENGDIDVAAGGTEKSLWTLYCIPYLSGTTAFGEIPIGTAGQVLKVSAGATGYEFAAEADPTVDTDAEIKAILVDEVIKTGDFTAGKISKINNATGIIEEGTNTDTDVADAVTKKHSQNSDTDLDPTFEATFVKKADTVNVLSDITSTGANIEDAVTKRHSKNADTALGTLTADVNMGTHKLTGLSVPSATGQSVRTTATITEANLEDAISKKHSQNTDTDLDATFEATFVKKADTVNVLSDITSPGADIEDAVTKKHIQNTDTQFDFYNALASDHTYSGLTDTQPVGEPVVFGQLLYFNWTDKEWRKTDADTAATMPGLRIALETKSDGETCKMLVKGYIRIDIWDFTGAMIYASVATGMVSSTAPTETGDQVQRVGMAKSADILFFDPSIDVGEI